MLCIAQFCMSQCFHGCAMFFSDMVVQAGMVCRSVVCLVLAASQPVLFAAIGSAKPAQLRSCLVGSWPVSITPDAVIVVSQTSPT